MVMDKGKCARCGQVRKLATWKPNATEVLLCARCIREELSARAAGTADNGGAREGSGRKPLQTPRDQRTMIQFTAAELAAVERAAKIAGEKVATFCRIGAVERAHSILQSHKSK